MTSDAKESVLPLEVDSLYMNHFCRQVITQANGHKLVKKFLPMHCIAWLEFVDPLFLVLVLAWSAKCLERSTLLNCIKLLRDGLIEKKKYEKKDIRHRRKLQEEERGKGGKREDKIYMERKLSFC